MWHLGAERCPVQRSACACACSVAALVGGESGMQTRSGSSRLCLVIFAMISLAMWAVFKQHQ